MSSPLGHSLAGLVLFGGLKFLYPRAHFGWKTALFFIVLCNLPDVDVIPAELWASVPDSLHRTVMHSALFALASGLAAAGLYQRIRGERLRHLWWLCPLAVMSHGLMDLSCLDYHPPYGVQFFWPLPEFVHVPLPFMRSIGTYRALGYGFAPSILYTVAGELLIFTPVLLWVQLALRWQRRRLGRL